MLFFTYLRRELRHRMRQTVVTAAGLALGIGLVITVTALSSGCASRKARCWGRCSAWEQISRSPRGARDRLSGAARATKPTRPPPGWRAVTQPRLWGRN
jgi:hypothetical protein